MQKRDHLILIGPMGSGKSTTGLALATRLGLAFVDLDACIVARAGQSIPRLFEVEGEAGFRQREALALREALAGPPAVIATGGGAVLRADNRRAMAAGGRVVYLHVSPGEQLRRIAGDANRPLLDHDDPATRLAQLQAEREPLYREIADLILDSDAQTPQQLAAALSLQLQRLAQPAATDLPA